MMLEEIQVLLVLRNSGLISAQKCCCSCSEMLLVMLMLFGNLVKGWEILSSAIGRKVNMMLVSKSMG